MESSESPALDIIKSIKALAKDRKVKVRAIEVEVEVDAETGADRMLEGKRTPVVVDEAAEVGLDEVDDGV